MPKEIASLKLVKIKTRNNQKEPRADNKTKA